MTSLLWSMEPLNTFLANHEHTRTFAWLGYFGHDMDKPTEFISNLQNNWWKHFSTSKRNAGNNNMQFAVEVDASGFIRGRSDVLSRSAEYPMLFCQQVAWASMHVLGSQAQSSFDSKGMVDCIITHLNEMSVEVEREYHAIAEEEYNSKREIFAFDDKGFEDDAQEASEESVEMDFEEEQESLSISFGYDS